MCVSGWGLVDELRGGHEPQGQDEDRDVEKQKPLEEEEVGCDPAAKVPLDGLDGVTP